MILALLLACPQDPPDNPQLNDRLAYAQAIGEDDPRAALALCDQIEDVSMHGECSMFAARAIAQQGGDGEAVCEALPTLAWREVCFFEIVDASGTRGENALKACQRTGAFKERCLAHALQREERNLMLRFGAGQEAELMAYIREQTGSYGLADITEEAIDVKIAARIMAQRVMSRSQGRPLSDIVFTRADCGTATDDACVEAYRILVTKAGRAVPRDCSPPMEVARIRALRLPTWSEDFQPLAERTWAHLCKRANTQQRPPDHGK